MAFEIYHGFSSRNIRSGFDTSLKGVALIKQDLLNHFETEPYERVGRQEFYSLIPTMIFKKDDISQQLARMEVERVLRADPRVTVRSLDVRHSEHSVEVRALLYYIEYDMEDAFYVAFGDS